MPPIPHPGARAVRFDDSVALDCSRRLDELADRLEAVARIDRDRVGGCTAEWRGPSRAWFDGANEAALAHLGRAAAAARGAAERIRQQIRIAAALQLDLNDRARRAELVEIARLEQLADAGS